MNTLFAQTTEVTVLGSDSSMVDEYANYAEVRWEG